MSEAEKQKSTFYIVTVVNAIKMEFLYKNEILAAHLKKTCVGNKSASAVIMIILTIALRTVHVLAHFWPREISLRISKPDRTKYSGNFCKQFFLAKINNFAASCHIFVNVVLHCLYLFNIFYVMLMFSRGIEVKHFRPKYGTVGCG